MKNKISGIVALYGVMLAVLFVSMSIDRALSVALPISFAIASVAATATFALTRRRLLDAFGAGFFFGVASLITAFMFGKEAFYNPLVAVLPRAFVGLAAILFYFAADYLFGLFIKNERIREFVSLLVGGGVTALANTVFTLTCLWVFAQGSPTFTAFAVNFLTNILPEMGIAMGLTPFVVLGVRHGLRLNIDGTAKAKKEESPANEAAATQKAEADA